MTVITHSMVTILALVFATSLVAQQPTATLPQSVNAQGQPMPQQGMPQYNSQQFAPRFMTQPNNVWNQGQAYNPNFFNRSPWSNTMPMPWNNNGYNGNNFNMPWNNNGGNGFNMPWNNGSNMPWNNNNGFNGSNMPWNNGSNNRFPTANFNGPWNNGNNGFPQINGPWNNSWGAAPWSSERWKNDPMGSPSKWFNFDDPKEGVAEMWEDGIRGPHRLGQMPGGWTAPSISVPNPVDVTDTFGKRWRGLPSEISEEADNFTYNVVK